MPQSKGEFTLIRAARLIDGRGGPPLERGAVLLEGDKIRAVGTEESIVPPEGVAIKEINYEDQTILPGLVDCHVHLIGIGDGRAGDELTTLPDEVLTLQAARNARAHLFSGVTTVRDCGAKNNTTFMLRDAIEMGITTGPRLVLAGRPMAIVGGHLSYFGIEATGPNDCKAHVRQLIKEGADFIKITATGGSTRTSHRLRPSFDVDELKAICDEAHKFGKHTAAHCASTQGMVNCLDAGVDTLIHAVFAEPDGTRKYRPEVAERIAEQGVFVNPTLYSIARADIRKLETKNAVEGLTEKEQADLDEMRRAEEHGLECAAKLMDLGVRIAAGSDAAWGPDKMGAFQHDTDIHIEMGMSPMEAIVSATSNSAKSSWIDDVVGTLVPEKRGDILVVKGDPSKDIKALWNVADVFQNGRLIDRGSHSTQPIIT